MLEEVRVIGYPSALGDWQRLYHTVRGMPVAHSHTNSQHVPDGPQPIFGLAMACADWVQTMWNMRGLPGPGGGR